MPEETPIATLVVIIVTAVISILAFQDRGLRERLIFHPQSILAGKEYHRLVTSAFLHLDWQHLIFNMLTLYLFGRYLEPAIGVWHFLAIYFAAIFGGNLLSLCLHRNHEYLALGASGGVCGIVFASIFLFPGGRILIMPLPVGIPSWLYAILFLAFEFYGTQRQDTHIGHDAHLGGAIIGLLTTTALFPEIVNQSPWLYAAVLALSLAMFIYFWKNPLGLPLQSFFGPGSKQPRNDHAGPSAEEVDAVLEKVSRNGIHSLSKKEQQILKQASEK